MDVTTAFWVVILLPLLSAPLIYLVGRLSVRRNPAVNPARWIALVVLVIAIIYSTFVSGQCPPDTPKTPFPAHVSGGAVG